MVLRAPDWIIRCKGGGHFFGGEMPRQPSDDKCVASNSVLKLHSSPRLVAESPPGLKVFSIFYWPFFQICKKVGLISATLVSFATVTTVGHMDYLFLSADIKRGIQVSSIWVVFDQAISSQ